MENLIIKKLKKSDPIPWELLLLADPSKEKVKQYITAGVVYIGLLLDKVIGVYVLTDIAPGVKELKNLAVNPAHQSQGIGKKLVLDAITKSKDQDVERIEVGTGNSSLTQLNFYKKCGFKTIGIIKNYFIDNYDDVIMENGIQCRDMIRLAYKIK